MSEYIRARSKEQKEMRMKEIMDVTEKLFETHPYHEIILTTIAKELGWSRGNLYKYVNTKEEIFLAIYLEKQGAFIDEFLAQYHSDLSDEQFVSLLAECFYLHQDLLKYHGILNTIIETNSDIHKVAQFKLDSMNQRKMMFTVLQERFSKLNAREISNLYLTIIYHGVGVYAHTSNKEFYKKAFEIAGMNYNEDDFKEMMIDFLNLLMNSREKN